MLKRDDLEQYEDDQYDHFIRMSKKIKKIIKIALGSVIIFILITLYLKFI